MIHKTFNIYSSLRELKLNFRSLKFKRDAAAFPTKEQAAKFKQDYPGARAFYWIASGCNFELIELI